MKIQQRLFKILRKQNVTDGRMHGRTHGQRENSIPTINKVCGGDYQCECVCCAGAQCQRISGPLAIKPFFSKKGFDGGNFDHQKHMFKFMGKKIITILRSKSYLILWFPHWVNFYKAQGRGVVIAKVDTCPRTNKLS